MILIEYLIAQFQEDSSSYAIKSRRPANNNPAVLIHSKNKTFIWDFTGLQIGMQESVTGQPRQNHFDFYIGLDDLIAQRHLFPGTKASSIGLTNIGLRIPVGSVRPGGKDIAWRGALARLAIKDLTISMPPLKIKNINDEDLILNIDKEFSKYPIDNGNGQTTRELHFGFENPFSVRFNRAIKIPRIVATMTSQQYATVLEAIDTVIQFHTTA